MTTLARRVVHIDILPNTHRDPWTTWRPAGETFVYLRGFATRRRVVLVGIGRR